MPSAKRARVAGQPVDEVGDAVPAERRAAPPTPGTRGRGGRARGPCRAGRPVGVAGSGSRRACPSRPQRRRVAHDRDAAVVGDVERLVRVGRPRVGARHPGRQVAVAGRWRRRTARTRRRRAPRRRARARAAIAWRTGRRRRSGRCPPAGRRSSARCRPRRQRGARARPGGCGPGRRRRPPRARPARGSAARGRRCRAARRRRAPAPAGEPVRPRAATSQPARRSTSSRAAARQVKFAIVAAGDEADGAAGRQPQQVEQPGAGDLLDRRVRRGRRRAGRRSGPRR